MELNAIVQKILQTNDFVSLPGLGSIVRKYESARLADDGKTLLPPVEYFVFDSNRLFNDEAIENHLTLSSGITKSEASKRVDDFCHSIRNSLDQNESVNFPGIGSLRLGVDGKVELVADETFAATTYLPPIDIAINTIQDTKNDVAESPAPVSAKKDIEGKPSAILSADSPSSVQTAKPRAASRTVVISLLSAVLVAAIVSTFILVPNLRFWERKPTEKIVQADVVTQGKETHEDSGQEFSQQSHSDSVVIESQSKANHGTTPATGVLKQTESTIVPIDKKSALLYQEKAVEESKTYYIVIGSFASQANAQKLVEEISQQGYKPFVLPGNNVYRVVIYQFTNRDRALRELERVRGLNLTSNAWLLTL